MEMLKILKFKELSSTNNYATNYIKSNKPDSSVLIWADYQTKGKGQMGNAWESEKNTNLTFSIILLTENIAVDCHFLISKAAALSIIALLEQYKLSAEIKWPNDIYINNKKIGGILIENSIQGNTLKNSIVGIGLNVNQKKFSDELPNPTSMFLEKGKKYDLNEVLDNWQVNFTKIYTMLLEKQYKEINKIYFSKLFRKDGFYQYRDSESEFNAHILEVKNNGELYLEKENGDIENYFFKEVEFIL